MRWVIDVPRTLVTWLVGILATVVAVPAVIVLALINDTNPAIETIIRAWSRSWMLFSGTKLVVRGQENVDVSRSYVVVANHLSAMDIMACFLALPVPIRYLAKKELFRIPLFAQGMRAAGIVEVDRAARGAVHAEVNRQSKILVEKGRSVIIYAEGTRPRDGVMTRFKKGAFTMAVAGQLPVLPVTINGSYEAWPPGKPWMHGGTVEVVIDPPIETTGMAHADVTELRNRVHDQVAKRVLDMGGKVRGAQS